MNLRLLLSVLLTATLSVSAFAQDETPTMGDNVVYDQGVGLEKDELEFLVSLWTADMQSAAANDSGDRIELVNLALSNKKIAEEAAGMKDRVSAEVWWRHQAELRNLNRQFVVKQHMANLEIPDFTELAKERYETQKDRFALVKEQRQTSHILYMCPMGQCGRETAHKAMAEILAELEAGADFEEMAKAKSQDPSNAPKGGKVEQWLTKGMEGVDPHYVHAAFQIAEVGELSPTVDSRFGVHIIRLDDIKPAHHKSFEEVKADIVAVLEKEYRELAAKAFDAKYRLSPEAQFDNEALDEIFAQYVKQGKSGDVDSARKEAEDIARKMREATAK